MALGAMTVDYECLLLLTGKYIHGATSSATNVFMKSANLFLKAEYILQYTIIHKIQYNNVCVNTYIHVHDYYTPVIVLRRKK